jgi:hypothetical protein
MFPKDLIARGYLHLVFSLVASYAAFFVGTISATLLIICAVLNSGYAQWLISHPDNRPSE